MRYVLDTNTVSRVMGRETSVCDRLLARSRNEVLVPQPVVAEIEYGLSRLPDSKRRARLAERFEVLFEEMPRAAWTDEVSRAFGRLKAHLERRGQRLEDFDVAIAAHALALDAILVSSDAGLQDRIPGLRVEDWWTPGSTGETAG